MILSKILDSIMDLQGDFEFLEFNVGKRKNDYSSTKIQLNGKSKEHLDQLIVEVLRLGATLPETHEVEYEKAPGDMILPDKFYCTTHHPTWVYHDGEWVGVEDLMMDKQIVIDPDENRVYCKPISTVKKNDLIVVGEKGIRIKHPERPRGGPGDPRERGGASDKRNPPHGRRPDLRRPGRQRHPGRPRDHERRAVALPVHAHLRHPARLRYRHLPGRRRAHRQYFEH